MKLKTLLNIISYFNYGFIKLIRKKQMNGNDRLKYLKESIEYWCNPQHKIDKTIEIIQLYYNQ